MPSLTRTPNKDQRPNDYSPVSPLHGYRGERTSNRVLFQPRSLCITVSREAGSRGGTIARKVGEILGWQVFDQESLSLLLDDSSALTELLRDVPAGAAEWCNLQIRRLIEEKCADADSECAELIRNVVLLAARGDVIIIGQAAGVLLPRETTLNVRIMAPFERRVAYLSQSMRLTETEATELVQQRDQFREGLWNRFANPSETLNIHSFDCLLNSHTLGEAACAELIAKAIRVKQLNLEPLNSPNESMES